MRWLASALAIAGVVLSSCGSKQTRPSSLQRFDAMQPVLRQVATESDAVALDVRQLNRSMRGGRWMQTRREAVRLKQDTALLARRAGRAGSHVRQILQRERDTRRKGYYRSALKTLDFQWCEGVTLTQVANLVWRDPLVLSASDGARLQRLQGRAQWCAWMSVVWSRRTEAWQRRFAAAFRYVPVGETPTSRG